MVNVAQSGTGNSFTNVQFGSTGDTVAGAPLIINGLNFGPGAAVQTGNNNTVNTTQAGANESLTFSQIGNSNYLYNGQSTANDSLVALQTGDNNSITSNQYGSAVQTASVTQVGNGNTVLGTQAGGGANTATVGQYGNTNYANYQQTGSGNVVTITQGVLVAKK